MNRSLTDTNKVILIHGLVRTGLSMIPMYWYLKKQNFLPLIFNYPSRKYPIEQQAYALKEFLEQHALLGNNLYFVTHSLGSIVLQEMLRLFPHCLPGGRAVMLGPPNNGSSMARGLTRWSIFPKLFGPALQELSILNTRCYRGKLELAVVAGNLKILGKLTPFVSYPNDGIVSVDETSLLGAKDSITIPGLHAVLMCYPRILKQTVHFLRNGEFAKVL